MTFEFASVVAVDYWAERDVTMPCEPRALILSNAEMTVYNVQDSVAAEMRAEPETCTVLISRLGDSARIDPDTDWIYCQEIVHEFGHFAGLEHSYGGVMKLHPAMVPFGCAHQRQWMVLKGWRQAPRWVRHSPPNVRRLWLKGHGYAARTARQRWLRSR